MAKLKILICGSGIAGPALVYWLARSKQDLAITVMERSPVPRTTGQAIDIRGAAVDLVKEMGLEEKIRSFHSTEKGICFVDSTGKTKGSFPMSGSSGNQSMTSEYEIQRSDLSQILLDAAVDHAEWVYGEYVTKLEQAEDDDDDANGKVVVEYANGRPSESFDLVVGADGLTSRTRRLAFGLKSWTDHTRQLGQFCVLFTIPQLTTGDGWARWYNMPGGKLVFLRPDRHGNTAINLAITNPDLERFDRAAEAGKDELKKLLREEFKDKGWVINEILDGLDQESDLYHSRVAQVKMQDFVRGRVALVGDAGYCPSPISGKGTTAALVGAYILAGEISESPSDIPAALRRYQEVMGPQAIEYQKLIAGAPQIASPQTQMGISIQNAIMAVISTPFVRKFAFSLMMGFNDKKAWKAPEYSKLAAS